MGWEEGVLSLSLLSGLVLLVGGGREGDGGAEESREGVLGACKSGGEERREMMKVISEGVDHWRSSVTIESKSQRVVVRVR